jgi:hypothetical protein
MDSSLTTILYYNLASKLQPAQLVEIPVLLDSHLEENAHRLISCLTVNNVVLACVEESC